ncbi:DUF429 domain-containing protein [Rhizobium sp. Rhizsp82]|uniref:DUF429 domain-containing protein n=1 Tax=Rhizobium sp. Rhizsp82 TaxID=3243057 RepID=UPI0039B3A9DF
MSKRSVLGIDAAWTATQPSGVALISDDGNGWGLVDVHSSYDAFLNEDYVGPVFRHRGSLPNAGLLLESARRKAKHEVDLVAVDMPLSLQPIVGRRASDNLISAAYGARHASTHSPSQERPGRLSDDLRAAFAVAGYPLAVTSATGPALIEVYPHPALIELASADRRLPYKQAKARKYWPGDGPDGRRANLLRTWREIIDLIDVKVAGVGDGLMLPSADAPVYALKAFEDALDAVVCAWVGACVLDGRARPYGDETSAIWVPDLAAS